MDYTGSLGLDCVAWRVGVLGGGVLRMLLGEERLYLFKMIN